MKRLIEVHIIPDNNTSVSRHASLVKLFNDKMFNSVQNHTINATKISDESHIFTCLRSDSQKAIDHKGDSLFELYTLIVKDTSVTSCSADTIKDIIEYITKVGGFDLCYLCKWNDKCHLYSSNIATTVDRHVNLVRTWSPNGLQAIVFSPSGRDILLRKKQMVNGQYFQTNGSLDKSLNIDISNGNIIAMCTSVNIFNYDTHMNATTNKDYEKLSQCMNLVLDNHNLEPNGTNGAWIFVIILFILFLGWAVLRVGPRS